MKTALTIPDRLPTEHHPKIVAMVFLRRLIFLIAPAAVCLSIASVVSAARIASLIMLGVVLIVGAVTLLGILLLTWNICRELMQISRKRRVELNKAFDFVIAHPGSSAITESSLHELYEVRNSLDELDEVISEFNALWKTSSAERGFKQAEMIKEHAITFPVAIASV